MNNVSKCGTFHNMTALSYFSASVSVTLLITTFTVNTLLIASLMKNIKFLKSSIFYKLLLNIAIADLLTSLVSDVTSTSFHLKEGLRHPIPDYEVKLLHSALFGVNGASVITMAHICIDRVVAIRSPIRYRMGLKGWKSGLLLASAWLCSGLLLIPYFYEGYIRYLTIFSFVTVTIAFVSLVSAAVIYKIYFKPAVKITSPPKEEVVIENINLDVPRLFNHKERPYGLNANVLRHAKVSTPIKCNRPKQTSPERRVNKSFLIMLMVFLVTYLPATIMTLYMNTCTNCNCMMIHISRDLTYLFILSSALWRPLNFIFRLKTIRNEVKSLLCRNSKSVYASNTDETVSSPNISNR